MLRESRSPGLGASRRPGDDVGKGFESCIPNTAVIAGLVPAIPIREAQVMRQFYVYILASRPGGAIYVGVTNDPVRRVYEHKNGLVPGHTKRYGIKQLVHFEVYDICLSSHSTREEHQALAKSLQTRLIAEKNDTWRDLYGEIA